MHPILETLGKAGLIPVVKIDDASKAVALAHSLERGGLPCIEITFRTAAAADAIRTICAAKPEILVGAGTVINRELAKQAIDAGAQFIVAPGFNPSVIDWCLERNILVIPGINGPAGIETALERGLEVLKFFPAEVSGGTAMLEALAGPYSHVSFIPTGGIGIHNLAAYAAHKNVLAIGGSWMVKSDLIALEQWSEIIRLTEEAVRVLQGAKQTQSGTK